MLRFLLSIFLIGFLSVALADNATRVIYITLDGTRWQDVYLDHSRFQKLWHKYANQLTFYGAPHSLTTMEVASIPISLPSYQSQMAGTVQPCDGNECGRIHVTTLVENILHKLHLDKKEAVTFASWSGIELAVESVSGATYNNVGNVAAYDPHTHQPDAVMAELNQKQNIDYPKNHDENIRYDKYTFAQALHYLQTYQPRFMWISLNDADAAAHAGNLKLYRHTLATYDDMLDALFITLKNLKLDKNTMVIVTTDHGRGEGQNWKHHGRHHEAKQTWAFVFNGKLKPVSQTGKVSHYSTLSIRPTVETALGVS